MTRNWLLAQYVTSGSDQPRLGFLKAGEIYASPEGLPSSTLELIENWSQWESQLRGLDIDALDKVIGGTLVAPITYPHKVLCAGANYYDHAAEMGTARPDPTESPFFFLKPPTTTIVGTGTEIAIPNIEAAGLDWEIELAVVISDRCRNVSVEDAHKHIAGFTVSNDLSARGHFPRPNAVFPPFAFDWLKHKAFDGSCPIGPGIVPSWQIKDPQDLGLKLSVNGVSKQDSSTKDMVVGVYELLSAVSHTLTLEPGDIILTGTPAGVGMPRKDFLHEGDVIVAEIEGIGRIENKIVGVK